MIEINGKPADIASIAPLTVGDWRELNKHGITFDLLSAGEIEALARFGYYCAHKANEAITHADVDALALPELAAIMTEALAGSGLEDLARDPS